jgi:hypothetical protein
MFHVRNCSGSVGSIGFAQYGFEREHRNERLCACVKVQHDAHNRHALEDSNVQGVAMCQCHAAHALDQTQVACITLLWHVCSGRARMSDVNSTTAHALRCCDTLFACVRE